MPNIPSLTPRSRSKRSLVALAASSALFFLVAFPCLKFQWFSSEGAWRDLCAPCIRQVLQPNAAGFWQGRPVRFDFAWQRGAVEVLMQGSGIGIRGR